MKYDMTDEDYRYVYSRTPRLCVDLLIVDKDGLVLSRRDILPEKGCWHTPGGRVRYQESIQEAARRIAQEELSIEIELGDFFIPMEFLHDGEFVHSVSLAFFAKHIHGTIRGSAQAKEVKKWKELPSDMHSKQKKIFASLWGKIAARMR